MIPTERLGTVTCPSGTLVLVDGGVLGLWSHDRAPTLPAELYGAQLAELAAGCVDLVARGPDAAAAVRAAGLASARGVYVFDVPAERLDAVRADVAAKVAQAGLSATLEPLPARLPHRARVAALLEGAAAAEVPFHGLVALAFAGLPRDRALEVRGLRMPEGDELEGRWDEVYLIAGEGKIVRSERAGAVLVARARLLLADADALGAWQEHEALDGQADVIFWGRDAADVARRTGAPPLTTPGESGCFGWRDLDGETALARHDAVAALRSEGRKLMVDFRPHSHAYQLLAQVRASATGSGVLEVGGATMCGFDTTWGDGVFEVFRDLGEGDTLLRLRLALGR